MFYKISCNMTNVKKSKSGKLTNVLIRNKIKAMAFPNFDYKLIDN